MGRAKIGRAILTFTLVAGVVVSIAVDSNETHLMNPSWPEHARFHDAQMIASLCGISLTSLWLLWRRSTEPLLGGHVALATVMAFWLPNFFVTWVVPGTSLLVEVDEAVPKVLGIPMFPNAVIGAVLMLLSLAGYVFLRLEERAHA